MSARTRLIETLTWPLASGLHKNKKQTKLHLSLFLFHCEHCKWVVESLKVWFLCGYSNSQNISNT